MNVEEVVNSNSHPASRYRAENGAIFSSTKCPPGPGLQNSCELPFGFLWTPLSPPSDDHAVVVSSSDLQDDDDDDIVDHSDDKSKEGVLPPVLCLTCLTYLNLYAEFDLTTGIWICPLCGAKNAAPPESLERSLSSVLVQPYVEFRQPVSTKNDDDVVSIILVLDRNLPLAEAQAVGSIMQHILSKLLHSSNDTSEKAQKINVGLIVFGKAVSIYQLGISGMAATDVFYKFKPAVLTADRIRSRSYTTLVQESKDLECLWRCLSAVYGIILHEPEDDENTASNIARKTSRLERLKKQKEDRLRQQQQQQHRPVAIPPETQTSPWDVAREEFQVKQTQRCTGEAIQFAIDLAAFSTTGQSLTSSRTSRILLFTNGCPNYGDGSVVTGGSDASTTTRRQRQHPDIVDPAKLAQSVEFFTILAESAMDDGVAIDVMCTGALELGLPAYQALVQPSSGYVLPHHSFTSEHLERNVEYLLLQTYGSRLVSSGKDALPNQQRGRSVWMDGCLIDIRMSSFLSATHWVGPGVLLENDEKKLLSNERAAFASGSSLAAKNNLATNNLPSRDIVETTLMRLRMGRADPVSTFTFLAQVNEFFQREPHAFFQCVVRYVDRPGSCIVTRVFTHRMSVAKQTGEFLDAVDEEVIPVLLGKEAVYRSMFGREINKRAGEGTVTPDVVQLENLAYDAQRDLDATIQRISGAYRLLSLERGTTHNGMDLTEEGGVKAAGSSVDFAFPPELSDALRRLYHFRRGQLLSPGPMQSMDDRAEIRSLFIRLPLDDCLTMMALSLWRVTPQRNENENVNFDPIHLASVPPESLTLWDNSILAGDLYHALFVWSGRGTTGTECDIVRERLKRFLLERSKLRFPVPVLHVLSEDDSMSRRFTAVLAPSHGDPVEHQLANFPALSSLTPSELTVLQAKFKFYDPDADPSFRNWFWSVASAASAYKDEGLSLCE